MNNSFRFYIFIILLFISFTSFAQNSITTVSGQILDQETSEPIPFASIYIKALPIGTTSNEEGYFVFHIPAERETDTIVISAIGYLSISKKGENFIPDQKVYLSSKITDLDEVILIATKKKELTAKEIVKKAYAEIPNNYPSQPYILEGYIRDLQKEDDKYVEYLECAAKFLYQGYKTKKEPHVELLEVRTSYLAEKHPWNENSERKNSIIDLVEDEFIRFDYGPIKGKNGWKFELENVLPYNKGQVYKITANHKPFQKATLFIDTETFAFVRMELTRQAINDRSWARRFTNGALQVYYNVIFEYQEFNGKMYLKYQKEEDTWKIFKEAESKKLLLTQYPKKELFINKIIVDNVEKYPFKRNMDIGTSIENQAKHYNAEFWSSYNIPKQTEGESKIISELKKRTDKY
ncbi:carboxypeptidase-like regulatory domain-containing protein [Spongiimicrobium sp. 3-5]|uniref:carboxypeptidase-like regulatory domain-containing protein n=1 Tax=Spongiimicrobium sp. 3-5 TaxID=3332596 RepID=UPI003980F08E